MKTVFEINSFNVGSTGKIMLQIADTARKEGFVTYTCCPKSRTNISKKNDFTIFIGNAFSRFLSFRFSKITGLDGFFSLISTLLLIGKMKQKKCDLIHLHNLHGYYLNYPLLFRYIKKSKIPTIWTLHDCWSFTGRCPYFDMVKCEKWKKGCGKCPYPSNEYPFSAADSTNLMWKKKKKWFAEVANLTLATPSFWLANLVKQSFLKDYTVQVIHNGIDLNIFKPIYKSFRESRNLQSKKIVLGVSFAWGTRKGLDVFVELTKRLPPDYIVVLVGTNGDIDQNLPSDIISIHKTNNQQELAEIYSAADVFVNPTREDNFPTVNIESLACGTPVVTFRTGGSPEIIDDTCGYVVERDDVEQMFEKIKKVCELHPFSQEKCRLRAELFDMKEKNEEYIKLYTSLVDR